MKHLLSKISNSRGYFACGSNLSLRIILLFLLFSGISEYSAQNFFPLQIGNSFLREKREHNYGHSGHFNSWNNLNYYYDSTSVADSIIFDNKKFYNYHDHYYHFAESENKLYIKIEEEIKLAVDFSAPAGESDTLYFNNQKRTYINSGIYIDTVYGEVRQCYSLDRTIIEQDINPWNYHTTTWVYNYTFVKGIGLYKEINNYNYQGVESSDVENKTYINIINRINGNYFTEIVPPENLQANLTNNFGVYLKWEYGSRMRDAFEIERRREDESEFHTIKTLPPNSLNFIDTSVASGYTYSYRVLAVTSGFKSSFEKTVSILTLFPPVIVSVDTSVINRVKLNWEYNSDSIDGFIVEKCMFIDTSDFPTWSQYAVLDSIPGNSRFIIDTNVTESQFYMYRMYAYLDTLKSSSSGEIIVAPKFPPPAAPTNLECSLTPDEGIRLQWKNPNAFETSAVIERRIDDSLYSFEIIDEISGFDTIYFDYEIEEMLPYQYRVKYLNFYGPSEYSNIAEIFSPLFHPLSEPMNVSGWHLNSTIKIEWQDMSSNESGFRIECFNQNTGWVKVAETGMNDTIYIQDVIYFTGIVPYRIFAFNPHGTSNFVEFNIYIRTNVDDESPIPNEFKLFTNYPNPFNPTTKIKYSIPSGEAGWKVNLRIYDIIGNKILTLVDDFKSPGIYEVEFNAEDLSSGVYIYELQYGSHRLSKKMALIK